MSARDLLGDRTRVFVRQRKEWTEILVDWETINQYAVLDEGGTELGTVAEKGSGLWRFLRRGFLRSHRPLEVAVADRTGRIVLSLDRPFFLLFSDLDVRTPEGGTVGHVKRRFGVIYKRYDLLDETGQLFARIASPRWRLWTFPVATDDGQRTATISKKWGGGLREIFTDADTFLVDFEGHPWTEAQRAVIFCAALSIDFDFFENNQGRGGLLGGGD